MAQTASSGSASRARVVRGIIFAGLGGTCWGFSGTCSQLLTNNYGVPVSWVICVRLGSAAVLFLAICAFKNWRTLRAALRDVRSLAFIAGFALLGVLLTQVSYLTAIAYTNAGTGTVLERLGLIVIMAYACIRAKRAPRSRELIGLAFAIAGVFLIATKGDIGSLAIPPQGLFWGLVSAVALAFYTLMPVKPLAKWGSMIVTGLAMLIGGAVSTVAVQPWNLGVTVTPEIAAAMAAMVLIGTFGAYLFYLQGITDAGSVRASLVGCVEPVSALVISCVWLGTAVTPFDVAGTALIIAMVVLTTQRDAEQSDEKAEMPPFQGGASLLGYYRARRATVDDLAVFSAVLDTGHELMAQLDVEETAGKRYPSQRRIMRAIDRACGNVVTVPQEHGGPERIIGVFSLDLSGDAAYAKSPDDAAWLSERQRADGSQETPDYAALHWVTVVPEARRCGVGTFIVEEAVRIAREAGKASVRADVYPDNAPMIALLERCGFQHCGMVEIATGLKRAHVRAAFEKMLG